MFAETGERVDFHALRVTFRMYLHRNKVPLEAAVLLMRHSDPRLTMREYCDVSQLEIASVPDKLRLLPPRLGQSA